MECVNSYMGCCGWTDKCSTLVVWIQLVLSCTLSSGNFTSCFFFIFPSFYFVGYMAPGELFPNILVLIIQHMELNQNYLSNQFSQFSPITTYILYFIQLTYCYFLDLPLVFSPLWLCDSLSQTIEHTYLICKKYHNEK